MALRMFRRMENEDEVPEKMFRCDRCGRDYPESCRWKGWWRCFVDIGHEEACIELAIPELNNRPRINVCPDCALVTMGKAVDKLRAEVFGRTRPTGQEG